MVENTYTQALDGAELVKVHEVGGVEYIQVWFGGQGINIYTHNQGGSSLYPLFEVHNYHFGDFVDKPTIEEVANAMERHYQDMLIDERQER